jgi:tetratricopeptide (TPR) repeat protein
MPVQTKNPAQTATLVFSGLLLISAHVLSAAELSPSQTVIVTSPKAKVFAEDKPIGEAAPGSVLYYSKTNEKWLMVPRHRGWINVEDVVPIEVAEEHFTSIISSKPTAEAYHHRGIVLLHLEKNAAALSDFNKSIELGNKSPAIYINRGNALQKQGELPRAISDFTEAIKLNPDLGRAYDNRSVALADMEQYAESLADSNMAIKLDPAYPEAYNNRGVTLTHLKKYPEAVADFDKALELFPKYADAFANRAIARNESGQIAAAVKDYEAALAVIPDSPSFENELAWILATTPDAKVRDPKRAVALAEKSTKAIERGEARFLDCLAAAYAASGRYDEAVKTAQEAVKLFGNDPDVKAAYERGELYRTGKPYIETGAGR